MPKKGEKVERVESQYNLSYRGSKKMTQKTCTKAEYYYLMSLPDRMAHIDEVDLKFMYYIRDSDGERLLDNLQMNQAAPNGKYWCTSRHMFEVDADGTKREELIVKETKDIWSREIVQYIIEHYITDKETIEYLKNLHDIQKIYLWHQDYIDNNLARLIAADGKQFCRGCIAYKTVGQFICGYLTCNECIIRMRTCGQQLREEDMEHFDDKYEGKCQGCENFGIDICMLDFIFGIGFMQCLRDFLGDVLFHILIEWDHFRDKLRNVSEILNSIERAAERLKCKPRCVLCHRIKHYLEPKNLKKSGVSMIGALTKAGVKMLL